MDVCLFWCTCPHVLADPLGEPPRSSCDVTVGTMADVWLVTQGCLCRPSPDFSLSLCSLYRAAVQVPERLVQAQVLGL